MIISSSKKIPNKEAWLPWWTEGLLFIYFILFVIFREIAFFNEVLSPSSLAPSVRWLLLWPLGGAVVSTLLPFKARWLSISFLAVFSTLLVITDTAYWRFYGTVSSLAMVSSIMQLGDVKHSVNYLIEWKQFIPLIFIIPFIIFAISGQQALQQVPDSVTSGSSRWIENRYSWSCILAFMLINTAYSANNHPIYEDTHHYGRSKWTMPKDHWESTYSNLSYATTFGLYNYHVANAIDVVSSEYLKPKLTSTKKQIVERVLKEKYRLNLTPSPLAGIAKGRDVVLIQLESLQNFLLDFEMNGHEVMPFLNKLKKSSLNWDYIFDVTHIGRTSDAEFAVMTGLLPDTRKPIQLEIISQQYVTLPKVLGKDRYESYSYHGYKKPFWNRAVAFPAYGFKEMHFQERFSADSTLGLGASDKEVFSYVADHIKSTTKPSFNFVISLSSHHPYIHIPKEYRKPYASMGFNEYGLSADYLASASYTDDALKTFFTKMKKNKKLDDTIFVIYGDHDRGGLGAQKPMIGLGNEIFSNRSDRIIFMIYIPGQDQLIKKYKDQYQYIQGGLQDLSPTLLHLLGNEVPYGVMGTHLFVDNTLRDPIPIPGSSSEYINKGALESVTNGRWVFDENQKIKRENLRPESYLRDQLIVQDLVDYIDSGILTSNPMKAKDLMAKTRDRNSLKHERDALIRKLVKKQN